MSKFRNEINSILRKLQNGDTSQQKVLYDGTINYLKMIALRYAVDKNDCEDILNDAYFRMFRYIKSADTERDGYNWMCKIVQNASYDFNKKVMPSVPLEDISLKVIVGDYEGDLIDKDELVRHMLELSEDEQKLIYYRFYEDMSYDEIAEKIGTKKSTAHKRIVAVIKKLRKMY